MRRLGVSSHSDTIFLCSLLFPLLSVHFLARFLMGTLSLGQPQFHLSLLPPASPTSLSESTSLFP